MQWSWLHEPAKRAPVYVFYGLLTEFLLLEKLQIN